MATDNGAWNDTKSTETSSINYLRNILHSSGYIVADYGVENFINDVLKTVRDNYEQEVNNHLRSMPDLIVIDKEKKQCHLVEVKFRHHKEKYKSFLFHKKYIETLCKYWFDAILIIIIDVAPYIHCIKVSEINKEKHFKESGEIFPFVYGELWDFKEISHKIEDIFPKVKTKLIEEKIHLLSIKEKDTSHKVKR